MRLILSAAIAMAMATGANATTIILDDFLTDQTTTLGASQVADVAVPGGFRDMQGVQPDTNYSIVNGTLTYATSSGVDIARLVYDGDDDPSTINITGLGGFDLTFGGTATSIVLDIESVSQPLRLGLGLWDMDGWFFGFSTIQLFATAPGPINFDLSLVTGYSGGIIDLSNIGAMNFVFYGDGNSDASISVNSIGVVTTMPAIPLPASGLLLGGALLAGFGAARSRRAAA